MKKCLLFLLFIFIYQANIKAQQSWKIDPSNSSIEFKVRHLLISTVPGSFNTFTASLETSKEGSFDEATIEANIQVNSVDTRNKQRDAHLLESDFFEAKNFPEITFKNASLKFEDKENFKITGMLSIKGLTKEVTFTGQFGGVAQMWGKNRAGFTATGTINRFDFGIQFNDKLDNGGMVVGKEVTFVLNMEFVQQN